MPHSSVLPVCPPPDTRAELVTKLLNLAESIAGGRDDDALYLKSAMLVIETNNGDLVPIAIGAADWASGVGLLFASPQEVQKVDARRLQC